MQIAICLGLLAWGWSGMAMAVVNNAPLQQFQESVTQAVEY